MMFVSQLEFLADLKLGTAKFEERIREKTTALLISVMDVEDLSSPVEPVTYICSGRNNLCNCFRFR